MADKTDIDDQDPLPESSFTWRRIFAFFVIAAVLYLVHEFAHDIAEVAKKTGSDNAVDRLAQIIRILIYFALMIHICYMVAPSAEQLARIFQAAAAMRSGVRFRKEEHRPSRNWYSARSPTETQYDEPSLEGQDSHHSSDDDVAPTSRDT